MSGGGAGTRTTGAGVGTALVDHFGTFHYTLLIAGLTNSVRSVKAFTRWSTTGPSVPAPVSDFFADFEGAGQAEGESRPDIPWFLGALNSQYEISASTGPMGLIQDITGPLSPSISEGFGFYHFEGVMTPTGPSEYMGFSFAYLSPVSVILYTIVIGDNDEVQTFRVMDSNSNVYFHDNFTATNNYATATINDWNSTVKNMLTMGKLWIQALDGSGSVLLQRPLRMSKRSFSAALTPATTGTGSGYAQFSLDRDGSLVYKVYMTGLLGLTTPPTLRLDAGSTSSQLFSQLSGVILLEASHGTYYAEGRLLLSDYTTHTDIYQFYQLYTSGKCSVYTTSGLALQGPLEAVNADDTGESIDLATLLTGSQVTPNAMTTSAGGAGVFEVQQDGSLHFHLSIRNPTSPIVNAYLAGPAPRGQTGPKVLDLMSYLNGFTIHGFFLSKNASFFRELLAGHYYIVVGTQTNPNGELRGQILVQRQTYTDILQPSGPITNMAGTVRFELDDFGLMHVQVVYLMGSQLSAAGQNLSSIIMTDAENTFSTDLSRYIGHSSVIRGTFQPTAQHIYALSHRRVRVNLASCSTCAATLTGTPSQFKNPVVRNGPPVIYHSLLSGASRPTVLTSATGACVFALDTNNDLHYFIKTYALDTAVSSILILNSTNQAQFAVPIANYDIGFGYVEGTFPKLSTYQLDQLNSAEWLVVVVTTGYPFGELVGSIVLDQRTETATLTSGSSSPTGGAAWATLSFDYSGGARVQWQIQGLSGPLTQANFADTQTTPIGASLLNTVVQSHSVMALYGQSPKWYPLLGRYSLQLRLGTQANPGGELNGFMRPNVTPQDLQYRALLSGFGVGTVDGSVKASATSAVGKTTFYYDGNGIRYNMALWGLSGPPKNISLYVGGPVGYASKMAPVFDFMPTFDGANANGIIPNVSRDMLVSIGNGTAYVLVTTDKYPSGEIRGNVELEFREVGVLATQASPSLSAVPTSGFVVGCRCYLTVVGLYCEVHKNNETAVITSIHVYDERSVFIADLTDIYTYFGSWFFFQANMADVANMYAGKYHLVLGTAKYPAGEIIGKIVVSRFHFTNYYSTNYHALFRGPSSRGGGFLKMNRATSFNYEYEGYIDGTMPMSCSLLLGAAETVVAQLGVNGPQLKGTAQLPDSVFSSTLKVSCRMADFTTWEGTVVLVEERFLGLLNGGGVVGSPQVTASAGIVAMQTDINRNLHYTGRTFNVSAASFGSMQMAFSDGPQFFTANATGSDSNIPISTGKRLNELYAMNTTIDVRPPSGSVGFAPILLAGRVIPFGPFQDTLNYLRGKPATTGQLNLAVTPGYFPSAIASDYQGQGGLVQLRYTRTNWQLSVSLYIGGLSNGMQQCGFWSSSGTQIIDLMPILGKGVYSGFVNRQINVYLNRQQLDMFKDNNVEFRTYSVAYSKSLGKIGSLVYNEIVNSAYSTALAATGSVKEETPNAFVGLIPDNYIFPAPSTLTYTFASGNTINNVGVFTTFPNGTLYTGWNSSYVPDYEVAPVMNVVLNLYIASKLYIQVYMTVNIEDINDHYPVFTKALNVTVNEDVGTVPDTAAITTIEVADRDSPIYGLPLVSLLNATNMAGEDRTSYFTIRQPLAGGPAGIYRAKVLDYDLPGNQWFKLDLMAIDGTPQTKDRKSTTTTIYISLRDLNDNRPMFDQKFYIAKPEETLAVGQVTLRVTATDADSTTNSQLQYSIVPTDNSPPTHFAVTTVKMGMWYICELKVNAMLDFETRRNYNLSLTAVDMGRPMLSQSVPVYIQVVNQPFKLVIQFPPPFLTVYNSTLMGNFANNNMAAFSFMTNNEDGITSVAFECRIVRSRQDCRYSRTAISACSATCGEGQRTVTLTVQSQAFPTDPSCVSKVIMEPCQDRLCPGSSTSAPLSRRRRMIPCGQDLYCEPLDLSDVSTNPFMPCITGTGPTAPSGTFTQSDPADGDYTFQLRANVNITHSGTGNSFSGYSNSSLVYTIDTTKPTTTIMKSDIPLQNNYTCPDIKFTADDLVQFWCKLEYQGEMRNFTRCTSPFNPCKQPTWYGYDELRRNGLYTFSVSAVDRALNREEFAKKITYEFDTYRPLVGLVDFPPRVNTLTSQAFEVITNDTEATVSCQLNGVAIACSVGRFSVVAVEGENHLTMTAQDKAGNVAPYVDYLFFVDSKAPEVELADLNDNVFTDRKNTLLHIQSNEQLADMRCRVVAWPNSANATEKLSECCDQAFSSASAKEENCLAACKDFSATSETNLDREVCRHFLRDYSKCLENKTMAFKNNGVAGLNRLPCGLDSDYPTSPSCRNGTFPIGTRARQLGFYLFQVKTRDLNDNAQCYQAAFVYEDASRYKTAEQDANDVVTDQTCPGDGLTYIIFLAIGGGALVIALVVCFTYYCCCVDRGNPYRRPMSVGPATANMAYNQSPSAGAGQGLEVDNQNMFDDSRYGGVQAGGTGDKAGLIGSMEEGQEEDLPGGDYEALQIN
ncbi:uncharacterized protein LOC135822896 [Sycon ciliatum]|uniref:uncharacterized protein LOC135822896 n=1 Tax=Sycon ciliatum TaxID=27933 RepID=UPI0031F71925